MSGDRPLSEREVAAAWLALYAHPDLADLDAIDAQWYAPPDGSYRRPLSNEDREAARVWLFMHTAGPALEALAAQLRVMAEQFATACAEVGKAFTAIRARMVEVGMVPEQPPSDPKARALHLQRRRNTGPAVHADPRRNRRPR